MHHLVSFHFRYMKDSTSSPPKDRVPLTAASPSPQQLLQQQGQPAVEGKLPTATITKSVPAHLTPARAASDDGDVVLSFGAEAEAGGTLQPQQQRPGSQQQPQAQQARTRLATAGEQENNADLEAALLEAAQKVRCPFHSPLKSNTLL